MSQSGGGGPGSGGLNNRFNSYQKSGTYIPPGQTLADQQTETLRETVQTHYQAEQTAGAVLNQLHGQRQQIQSGNDMTWEMRQATEQTKRELRELQSKYRQKKIRLYGWIAALSIVDFLLFIQLLRCRGGLICFN